MGNVGGGISGSVGSLKRSVDPLDRMGVRGEKSGGTEEGYGDRRRDGDREKGSDRREGREERGGGGDKARDERMAAMDKTERRPPATPAVAVRM
jgi:hypothetical protein